MGAPEHVEIEHDAHHVTLTPVRVRRWVELSTPQVILRTAAFSLGIAGSVALALALPSPALLAVVIALCVPVAATMIVLGEHQTRSERLQITPTTIAFGGVCWPLERIESWERRDHAVVVWVRLDGGHLRRYEIGAGWMLSEHAWLMGILGQAVRSRLGDTPTEVPPALRRMLALEG